MTSVIVKLTLLAAVALAEPSAYNGASGASAGSSASASSYAGSSANSYSGGQPGNPVSGATSGSASYSGASPSGSYPNPSKNAIPSGGGAGGYGNGGGFGAGNSGGGYGTGNSGGGYGTGNSGGSYASAYPGTGGSYSGTGGSGGSLPFNLPAGCFSGFPQYGPDPWQIHQQIMNNLQRIQAESQRFGGVPSVQTSSTSFTSTHHTSSVQVHNWSSRSKRNPGRYNGYRNLNQNMGIKECIEFIKQTMDSPEYSNFYRTEYTGTGGIPANAGAFSSGSIGPQGGYGQANIFPQEEGGVNIRFGESPPEGGLVQSVSGNIPPPSGTSYGISTSSQSSSTNINGQVTNRKESSVTINDNGKVTTYKAKSP